jgi:hypothetical protein
MIITKRNKVKARSSWSGWGSGAGQWMEIDDRLRPASCLAIVIGKPGDAGDTILDKPIARFSTGRARARRCHKAYLIMKKLKNEKELVKQAIAAGMKYGEERGVVEFEPTDSANEKIEYIYRLLVHDKVIQPIPEDQISQQSMRHKLAIWASKLK